MASTSLVSLYQCALPILFSDSHGIVVWFAPAHKRTNRWVAIRESHAEDNTLRTLGARFSVILLRSPLSLTLSMPISVVHYRP